MMIEKFERQIEVIESPVPRLDLSLFKKRGSSKTYAGYLIQKMKEARDDEKPEIVWLIQHFYQKYLEFQKTERFTPRQWKGKSGVSYIEQPEKVICVRYQKTEPDDQAKEVRVEILREEINRVLWALGTLNKGDWIKTRDIAEKVYGEKWTSVFSNRPEHIKLCEIFNYLEFVRKIDYSRSGKVFLKE